MSRLRREPVPGTVTAVERFKRLGIGFPIAVRVVAALIAVLVALSAFPGRVGAHAELVSSEPSDGAVVSAPPREIVATFDEPLDPGRSRVVLRDAAGDQVANGGVDPAPPGRATMRIALDALAPGAYEVRWTAVTPDDGAVERGMFRFTLTAAASPTGSAPPTVAPEPTVGAGPTATADASAPPSPSGPAPSPTATLSTSGPTLPSPSPAASPSGPDVTPTGSDVLLPVVIVLAAGIALGAYLLRRRAAS